MKSWICCLCVYVIGVSAEKLYRHDRNERAATQIKVAPKELSDTELIDSVLAGNVPDDEIDESAQKKSVQPQVAEQAFTVAAAPAVAPAPAPIAVAAAAPIAAEDESPADLPAAFPYAPVAAPGPALGPAPAPAEAPIASPARAPIGAPMAAPEAPSISEIIESVVVEPIKHLLEWAFPTPPPHKPPTQEQVDNLDKSTFAPPQGQDEDADDGNEAKKKKRGHKGLPKEAAGEKGRALPKQATRASPSGPPPVAGANPLTRKDQVEKKEEEESTISWLFR